MKKHLNPKQTVFDTFQGIGNTFNLYYTLKFSLMTGSLYINDKLVKTPASGVGKPIVCTPDDSIRIEAPRTLELTTTTRAGEVHATEYSSGGALNYTEMVSISLDAKTGTVDPFTLIIKVENTYEGVFSAIKAAHSADLDVDVTGLDEEYLIGHSKHKAPSTELETYALMFGTDVELEDGERLRAISSRGLSRLAEHIWSIYGHSWIRIYDALIAEYAPLENYDMTQIETPNIQMTHAASTDYSTVDTHAVTDDYAVTDTHAVSDDYAVVDDHIASDDFEIIDEHSVSNDYEITDEHSVSAGYKVSDVEKRASDITTTNNNLTNEALVKAFNSTDYVGPSKNIATGSTTTSGLENANKTTTEHTQTGSTSDTHTQTGSTSDTRTQTGGISDTHTQTGSTSDTRTQTGASSDTHTQTGSTIDSETGTRSLTRHGNIGVTTSQQMLQSEIDLRVKAQMWSIMMADADKVLSAPSYHEGLTEVWL